MYMPTCRRSSSHAAPFSSKQALRAAHRLRAGWGGAKRTALVVSHVNRWGSRAFRSSASVGPTRCAQHAGVCVSHAHCLNKSGPLAEPMHHVALTAGFKHLHCNELVLLLVAALVTAAALQLAHKRHGLQVLQRLPPLEEGGALR
jgi:hypothetical protein